MQELLLAEDIFDALMDGDKDVTIRKGRRNIQLGDLMFKSTDKRREQKVTVRLVMYCALSFIPEELVWADGFESHEDMEEKMKRFYQDINMDTECTVVIFDNPLISNTEKEEE